MHALIQPLWDYVVELPRAVARGWSDFWFRPTDPTTLAAVRICVGLVLLYIHATCTPYILDFVGPNGWIDAQAVRELADVEGLAKNSTIPELITEEDKRGAWWHVYSVWFLVENPTLIIALHSVFLLAIVCFLFGFCSRTASIIVWVGHLSYIQRGYNIWFGMDVTLLMLTLYLMFGPTGATLSIDRWLARLREARSGLKQRAHELRNLHAEPSWSANTVIRMIQVHMAIIYLFAGLSKLQGASWWNGLAIYFTMMIPEFRIIDFSFLARGLPDMVLYTLSLIGSYATLAFEIGFIFLIWNRRFRPPFLFLAVMLHVGIAVFMGLGGFASIMLTGCLAFVDPASMRWFLTALFKGPTGLRFVYDRQQDATISAASVIHASDPFGQVALLEANDTGAGGPAGSLVLPGGSVVRGTQAFGSLVRPLRALWIVWPLALGRFVGISKEELTPAAGRR